MTLMNTWPEQITLPGQAAAPEGPCDLWMMYVTHFCYRRDLAKFCDAAEHTPVTARATWQALADRWHLFSLALHHHHHAEDVALWPLLTSRADADGQAILAAMEAEHAEIDPILAAVADGLALMSTTGDGDERAALIVRLVAGRQSLGAHLGHEETEAIALMQRVMTEPEWLEMQRQHFQPQKGEVTFRLLRSMLGWTTEGLPVAVRDRVLADPPVIGRLMHRLFQRGWLRRERAAFRYCVG